MNILYIGPYRQDNVIGWSSTALLKFLLSNNKYNITCRPIYLSHSRTLTDVDMEIRRAENNTNSSYDAIIQNSSLDSLTKIHSIPKNIAIPIIDSKAISNETIDNLHNFDKILVDSKLIYNRLQQYKKIQNKIKTYDYDILTKPVPNSAFRIGVLECSKKLYFIGKYSNNINNIINLCKAFIKNIKCNEYALILFLFDLDIMKKKHIETIINKYYVMHNMKHTINRIILVPIDTKLDNVLVAHQTGDIYLDLQDDNSNTLNTKIASSFNKTIVQFNYDDMAFNFDRNDQENAEGFVGISERAIDLAIQSCILNNSTYAPKPFKKENIFNLL